MPVANVHSKLCTRQQCKGIMPGSQISSLVTQWMQTII